MILIYFWLLLATFGVFWQPFGTLGLLSGAFGPQVGIMSPRGQTGGEFVIQIGGHLVSHFLEKFWGKLEIANSP